MGYEYFRQIPGEDAWCDAWNLIVAASEAEHRPDIAERVVRNITRHVNDWEQLTAHLAMIGAKLAEDGPTTVRKAIESRLSAV